MCNENCINWGIANIQAKDIAGKNVLEVGSENINGSLRAHIESLKPLKYVGIDIKKGKGVDLVCKAENIVQTFGTESFDYVISTCVLEHIKAWRVTVHSIKLACRVGGKVLLIVPSKWEFHSFPNDYWRFKKTDLEKIFSDFMIEKLEEIEEDSEHSLVYLIAEKTGKPLSDLNEIKLEKVKPKYFSKQFLKYFFERIGVKKWL